jgi:hypothetical protein
MTTLTEAGQMMQMLHGILDMHFVGHYGKVREAGDSCRITKSAFKTFLTRAQGEQLASVGVLELYNLTTDQLMPVIDLLDTVSPDLRDPQEMAEMWGASSLGPYVFARIVVTCMLHPELTGCLVSSLLLLEIPVAIPREVRR